MRPYTGKLEASVGYNFATSEEQCVLWPIEGTRIQTGGRKWSWVIHPDRCVDGSGRIESEWWRQSDMRFTAIVGLTLGIIALILGVIFLNIAQSLSSGWSLGVVIIIFCAVVGLFLSVLALFRMRGRKVGRRVVVSALAVNVVAIVGAGAIGVSLMAALAEPTFGEAIEELTQKDLTVRTIGGERPALLALPYEHDPQMPLPLALSLHGLTSHYMAQDSYFGLSSLVNTHNFALLLPNGMKDDNGDRYWNATDFCCGSANSKPDDVAYLTGLVAETTETVNIGPIFLVGMSNGASMSYRLACENLPGLTAIVAVAGSFYSDPNRCAPAHPVSVLHIHGTDDNVIKIEGGSDPNIGPGTYPPIRETVQRWADRAGCNLSGAETLPRLDIDRNVSGTETNVTRFRSGCRDNLVVEYWELESSPHVPDFSSDFGELILGWLFDLSSN